MTEQARVFTITAWLDKNGNNQFDSGVDDQEQTKVYVNKAWTSQGTWTVGNAAIVKANADGASLQQLVLNITGNAADASALGNVGKITKDKEIDITPLIKILDQRVRAQVVVAAKSAKAANFGLIGTNARRGIANYEIHNMGETEVNNIFDLSVLNPYPNYHCWGMGSVELARGLIKGALRPGEFDKLGLRPHDFGLAGAPENKLQYLATGSLASVPTGYLVNFDNTPLWYTYLLKGPWANEFAIKTGNDKYVPWGVFPDRERTEVEVKQALLNKYNEQVSYYYKVGIKDIPGYQGTAWTVNMATLAQKIFNLRTGQTP